MLTSEISHNMKCHSISMYEEVGGKTLTEHFFCALTVQTSIAHEFIFSQQKKLCLVGRVS